MTTRALVLMLMMSGVTVPLSAQSQADVCRVMEVSELGQWATYDVTEPEVPGEPSVMTIAILRRGEGTDSDYYWLQMEIPSERGEVIMQMLVPGYPYGSGRIRAGVVKVPDQPAMRLSPEIVDQMNAEASENPADYLKDGCATAENLGWEMTTVPAGTIRALHLLLPSAEGGDAWISPDVPFGIVNIVGPGFGMALADYGMGAVSAITEEPREMH